MPNKNKKALSGSKKTNSNVSVSDDVTFESINDLGIDKSIFDRETSPEHLDIGFTPDVDGLNYRKESIPEESFEDLSVEATEKKIKIIKKEKTVYEHGGSLRSLILTVIYVVAVLIVGVLSGILALKVANDVFAFSYEKDENGNPIVYTFEITEDNMSVNQMAKLLKKEGVIKYPLIFKLYAQLKKVDIFTTNSDNEHKKQNLILGTHSISSAANYDAILISLNPPKPREEVDITFTETMTTDDIIDLLVENNVGTREGFIEVIQNYPFDFWFVEKLNNLSEDRFYRLDGYLYPDTYRFYTDSSEEVAIKKFLTNFDNHFTQECKDAAAKSGKTVDEIVILASIIQGETKRINDYSKVSGVFYNRMKSKDFEGRLDSDATIQYYFRHFEGARHSTITPEDLKIDTPYNTYLRKGLTPGAICNPNINAIKAALYPETNFPYYYFVSRYNGAMLYAKTYKEHQENIEKAKEEREKAGIEDEED